MYKVFRNSKVPNTLRSTFLTYERARQAIRKWLRSSKDVTGNASITEFGFSIQRTN